MILCLSACAATQTNFDTTDEASQPQSQFQSTTGTLSNNETTSTTTESVGTSSEPTASSKPTSHTNSTSSKSNSSGNVQKENQKAKEVLQKVLNKEQDFNFKSLVWDEVTKENLNKFSFPTVYNAINYFVPNGYLYVDFDSDGIEELVIVEAYLNFFLILRYDNGNVNGYMLENLNLQGIKTDGSFMMEFYKAHTTISRARFDGLDCIVTDIAYKNESKNIYKLNGLLTMKDEVEKYFDSWNQNTTKASWTKIS